MTDFLNFDLCKTSDLVSSGELSAAELTNAAIDRAEAVSYTHLTLPTIDPV